MSKPFYSFTNKADDEVELAIYDVVGFFGNTARDFRDQMRAADGKRLTVRINSPGGNVFDGNSIYNLIKGHKGGSTIKIDGFAGSIASVIAMAGERIVMAKNAMMMIHNPTLIAGGDAEEMRKFADTLDKVKETLVTAYVEQTGKRRETIAKLMDEETWLTAEEALAEKFVDEVASSKAQDRIAAQWKPEDHFSGDHLKHFTAVADVATDGSKPNNQQEKNDTMKPEEIQALQTRVSSLEAENTQLKDGQKTAVEAAKNSARQEVETAEANRRTKIQEIASKYNKDGDLNEITISALAGKTTPDEFKDQVLDKVNARPTRAAVRPQNNGAKKPEGQDAAYEQFKVDYAACESTSDRMALVAKNKAFARRLAQERGE